MVGKLLAGASTMACALVASGFAWAAQEHIDGFRAECEKQDPPLPCECIVGEAAGRLNDNQQAYLYALGMEDEAEIDRLASVMTADEIAGFEEFMGGIAAVCQ